MSTFVIGDIHGGYKALLQCLERAKFNKKLDTLISLGDVCDGWPQTQQVIDELLTLKHFILVLGNHDWWTGQWMLHGDRPDIWTLQGGLATIKSYENKCTIGPIYLTHMHLLVEGAVPFYIDDKNRIFVHGGFDRKRPIKEQSQDTLMWDRRLIQTAVDLNRMGGIKPKKLTEFNEVFIGHTPVSALGIPGVIDTPVNLFEIWDLDTGGGWEGKVTIMNVDTHKYWQSDVVYKLYPGEHGRRGESIRKRIKGYLA